MDVDAIPTAILPRPDPARQAADATAYDAALQGGVADPNLWLHLWYAKPHWFTNWGTLGARNFSQVVANRHNVYLGIGLAGARGTERQRLYAERAVGLLALPADLDVYSDAHPDPALPRTEDDCMRIIAGMGVAPTVIVNTGHGWQALWCFERPWSWAADDAETRRQAMRLDMGWQATLGAVAGTLGFTVDSIGDLARLVRPPGTWNQKIGCPAVPVTLAACDPSVRYTPEALATHVTIWEKIYKAPAPRRADAPEPNTPEWSQRRDTGIAPSEMRRVALKRYRKGLRRVREDNDHRRDVLFWLARQLDSLGMAPCEVAAWVEDFAGEVRNG